MDRRKLFRRRCHRDLINCSLALQCLDPMNLIFDGTTPPFLLDSATETGKGGKGDGKGDGKGGSTRLRGLRTKQQGNRKLEPCSGKSKGKSGSSDDGLQDCDDGVMVPNQQFLLQLNELGISVRALSGIEPLYFQIHSFFAYPSLCF
jgi:hypothetical protein